MENRENVLRQFVRDNLSDVDLYLALAEEAGELAQSAAKAARAIIGRNYTPRTVDECVDSVVEEFSDVCSVFNVLFESSKDDELSSVMSSKLVRWANRIGGYEVSYTEIVNNTDVVVEGKVVEVSDVVYGRSDGKPWYVTNVSRENDPYPVTATSKDVDGSQIARDLKIEWLTYDVPCVTSADDRCLKVYDKCFVFRQADLWTVVGVNTRNNFVTVRNDITGYVRGLPNSEVFGTLYDSNQLILNDLLKYSNDPVKYCSDVMNSVSSNEEEASRFMFQSIQWRIDNIRKGQYCVQS